MSWIVTTTSGWLYELGKPYYLRRVRASVGRMKYLQETLVDRRSDASKFKTYEAARLAAAYLSDPTTKVEEY